ncbi:MAG: T9SS type A sorting domain-containing protein [Anaerolineae bacterium]|nr:T9SS type A sorting domain-containing protein [Anaerolineae bacterium]
MKAILNTFLFLALPFSFLIGQTSGWHSQNSGTTRGLNGIYFINDSTGWVVGNAGTILYTSNQGNLWTHQNGNTSRNLSGIDFVTDLVGWAVGDNGTIIMTTNKGITWESQTLGSSANLNAVDFQNDSIGWVCGDNGAVFSTVDGGNSWMSVGFGTSYEMEDLHFFDDQNGFVVGGNMFLNTTDGGMTWDHLGPIAEDTYHLSIQFLSPSFGWVVGSYGDLFSGYTGVIAQWQSPGGYFDYVGGSSFSLNSVCFITTLKGWIVGDNGSILSTTDGGSNWETQVSGTERDLQDIVFINDTTGWAIGNNGTILSTKSGGLVAIEDKLSSISMHPESFVLHGNFPNPFNPSTTIRYELFKPANVLLIIFDLLGNEIKTLFQSRQNAGEYNWVWDGTNGENMPVSSGVYIYQLSVDQHIESKKMLLVR